MKATYGILGLSLTSVVPASGFAPLRGITVNRVKDSTPVDLGTLAESQETTLTVFGTYAADFNAIEYGQRLRFYMPELEAKGVKQVKLILNAEPAACEAFAKYLDLPPNIELLSDPSGAAGLQFGVARGFRPDDASLSPYVKLFAMLFGLGAPFTLPFVIAGYLGNPGGVHGWIEDALTVGQLQGRFPGNALEFSSNGAPPVNKFDELPLVGGWGRRPLELATLRLQNMVGMSIANWKELGPDVEAHPSVLTQLGGCVLLDESGAVKYEWKDPGICAVASFDVILCAL